jgi:hypothetical protein
MSEFQIGVAGSVLCGLIMVVGGLILVAQGAISLDNQSTGSTPALKFEFQGVSFITGSAAIALFATGALTVLASLWFAPPELPTIVPVQVQAKMEGDSPDSAAPTIYAAVPLSPMVSQVEHNDGRVFYKIDRPFYHRQDPDGESLTIIALLPEGKFAMREAYVKRSAGNGSVNGRSVVVDEFRLPSSRPAPLTNSTIVPAPPLPALDDSRVEGGR